MRSARKSILHRLLHPHHLAIWGLVSAIATVIGLVIVIVQMAGSDQTPDTAGAASAPAPPAASPMPASSSASSPGYSLTIDNAWAILQLAPANLFEWHFRNGSLVGQTPPPADGANCAPLATWAHSHGGVDLNWTASSFVVAAQSAQVIVDSATIEVIEKTPFNSDEWTDELHCGGGGPLEVSYLNVYLDTGKTIMTYHTSQNPEGEKRPFGLVVKPFEAEKVLVSAWPEGPPNSAGAQMLWLWRLKLGLIVNGTRTYAFVDNDGKPFSTVL